jgi:hypothetical protein
MLIEALLKKYFGTYAQQTSLEAITQIAFITHSFEERHPS